jgi:hypothetical protein
LQGVDLPEQLRHLTTTVEPLVELAVPVDVFDAGELAEVHVNRLELRDVGGSELRDGAPCSQTFEASPDFVDLDDLIDRRLEDDEALLRVEDEQPVAPECGKRFAHRCRTDTEFARDVELTKL